MEKYLSIITNFGCHYTCPYCIVKNNGIKIPNTTIHGLHKLKPSILTNKCNIVSVSGGGDPLHEYCKHIDWWDCLINKLNNYNIPLEIHTSYLSGMGVNQLAPKTKRMVYHLRFKTQLNEIKRISNELVRVVFVITNDMTEDDLNSISDFVNNSCDIDELTFRQRVDENYKTNYHLHNVLKKYHKSKWWYVEQADYNLYYVENNIYVNYKDISRSEDI